MDNKLLLALETKAKESNDGTRLLRHLIIDINRAHKKKTWSDYSLEEFGVAYKNEQCRQKWKKFRFESLPKDEWIPGVPIESEFKELIDNALKIEGSKTATSEGMILEDVPEGFVVTKLFSQQNRENGVKWLHSLERVKQVDEYKEFTEKAVQTFENIVLQHEPSKIYLLPQSAPTNWAMNVYISDAHIGAAIKDSLFGAKNNKETYIKGMRSIIDQVEKQHQRFGTFHTINIVLLGDLLDGWNSETVRSGHKLVQNLNNVEQFETFVKSFVDLFNTLVEEGFCKHLRFVSATNDNHGGDFSQIASRSVEIYLNAKYPDVETIVSRDFIFHIKTGKRIHIFSHGKNMDSMQRGLPWVLTDKHEAWFFNYIQYHGLNKNIKFNQEKNYITVVMGDLHRSKSEVLDKFVYKRIMASVVGTDYSEFNYSRGNGYCGFELEVYDTEGTDCFEFRNFFL
jgi:hypothetical protein